MFVLELSLLVFIRNYRSRDLRNVSGTNDVDPNRPIPNYGRHEKLRLRLGIAAVP